MAQTDVKMSYIEDDMKKVQVKTNLYIQKYGHMGVFHLAKEIVQNSIDELEDPNTLGNKINITYDELEDKLTIEDDGRGIPEEDYKIDVSCTKLQSGSKFFRSQGGKSSGEFGVGLTVVNALSSYFSLATYRGSYMHEIIFRDGEKVDDITRPLKKGEKKHGTKTVFVANPKYLGKDTYMPFDVLCEWLEEMSFQFSNDIKMNIEKYHGVKLLKKIKMKKKPFSDYIKSSVMTTEIGNRFLTPPINISGSASITEEVVENILDAANKVKAKKKKMKKDIHLDVTIAYTDADRYFTQSFCNFTKTEDGGVHLDSVEEIVLRFIQTKTKFYMTDKEKEKWDITWNDIKEGLVILVNLSTDAQVQFMGNAKNKIQNEDLKPILKTIVQDELNKVFEEKENDFKAIAKNVKSIARARVEASKNRKASKKERMDKWKEYEVKNYVPCNNTGKAYKEIFLIEGERSASGSVVNGRDSANTQAVFGFRGVTKNPYKCSFSELMANNEWKNLVNILRCGVGQDFNLNKLYFDKIIILTDADIDGHYITMGICGFFALYLPEIVEAGKLYKVFSPLYNIDDKNHPFVQNKSELMELFMEKIVKAYSIGLDTGRKLSKSELFDFLFDTVDYREDMINLQRYFKVNKYLIELIASSLVEWGLVRSVDDYDDLDKIFSNQKFITKLMSRIQKKYPEVIVKNKYIRGVVEGHYVSVEVNNRFIKKLEPFIEIYQTYGSILTVTEKKGETSVMSIAEFLDITYKLMPKIITRYKGLGEANPEQIGKTTLDPNNRLLVRLTMKDCKKAIETFYKLQGNRTKDKEARKKMMNEYKIDPEDLDN